MNKINYKFAFIVLHYELIDKTIKCVDNLLEKLSGEYLILIIDNGSKDKNNSIIETRYYNLPQVKYIKIAENKGFSGGHNIGYKYAKEKKYDFIALVNNDTTIISEDICSIIIEDFEKYNYGVLGPFIDNPDGERSSNNNPYKNIEKTDTVVFIDYSKRIALLIILKFLYHIRLLKMYMWFRKVAKSIISRIKRNLKAGKNNIMKNTVQFNCGLHGSYIILSPLYIKKYNDALEPVTFLYGEELLLYRKCKIDGITTVYEPRIRIWHDEHSVEKKQYQNSTRRNYNRICRELNAKKQIIRYIRDENKKNRKNK